MFKLFEKMWDHRQGRYVVILSLLMFAVGSGFGIYFIGKLIDRNASFDIKKDGITVKQEQYSDTSQSARETKIDTLFTTKATPQKKRNVRLSKPESKDFNMDVKSENQNGGQTAGFIINN